MKYVSEWYDTGRLADTYKWPTSIPNGSGCDVLNYEDDYSLAGCSGYVQYDIDGTTVTFAFSNPNIVRNKPGVGTGGTSVWDDMDNHDYDSFVVSIRVASGKKLDFECKCTGSTTNFATVYIRASAG